MKLFNILLLCFFLSFCNAQTCKLNKKLLTAIAKQEKHKNRKLGYPYLISFNNASDVKFLKEQMETLAGKWLDNRTYDCKNINLCEKITKTLVRYDIKNIDLGAMQICYYWNGDIDIKDYFDNEKATQKACEIIKNIVDKYGVSWESIGKYHSYNIEKNKKYVNSIKKELAKLVVKKHFN